MQGIGWKGQTLLSKSIKLSSSSLQRKHHLYEQARIIWYNHQTSLQYAAWSLFDNHIRQLCQASRAHLAKVGFQIWLKAALQIECHHKRDQHWEQQIQCWGYQWSKGVCEWQDFHYQGCVGHEHWVWKHAINGCVQEVFDAFSEFQMLTVLWLSVWTARWVCGQ